MQDLVTISVRTCRRPSLLLHTLHSCFLQDHRPPEVDVGDNSPAEDTGRSVRALSPPPGATPRYWCNEPATDLPGNLDTLFARARGRRLVLMNDDDAVLLPGAVPALLAAFDAAPDVVCSCGAPTPSACSRRHGPRGRCAPSADGPRSPLRRDARGRRGLRRWGARVRGAADMTGGGPLLATQGVGWWP